MNFIDLFNAVVRIAKPAQSEYVDAQTMEDAFEVLEIDSLDGLVILMYMCELYGIDDAVSKEWHPVTVLELHDLLMAAKTKEPVSVEAAVVEIK